MAPPPAAVPVRAAEDIDAPKTDVSKIDLPKENTPGHRFPTAAEAVALGDFLAAEAVKLAPHNLAQARASWREAAACYEEAAALAPLDAGISYSRAIALGDEAGALAGTDMALARARWKEGSEQYAETLRKNSREHDALNSWGLDLAAEAKVVAATNLAEARELWHSAGEKYAQALVILPGKHGAANNWGNALADEAEALVGIAPAEARAVWRVAREKYTWSVRIKPDKYNAMANWGGSLANEAEMLAKGGDWESAQVAWQGADEQYRRALAINPAFPDALQGYGTTLDNHADLLVARDPAAAAVLWRESRVFYARALSVVPDYWQAAANWAISLEREAKSLPEGKEAEGLPLWEESASLQRRVIALRPDWADAYTSLGNCLDGKARLLAGAGDFGAARTLWREAEQAYAQSMKLGPTLFAAKNWGSALRAEADYLKETDPEQSRIVLKKANAQFLQGMVLFPGEGDFALLSGGCNISEYELAASAGAGWEEQRELLRTAQRQYAAASRLEGSSSEVWEAWGVALLHEGRLIRLHEEASARDLLLDAAAKLTEATRLAPASYTASYNLAAVYESIANIYLWYDRSVALDYYRRGEVQSEHANALARGAVEPRLLLIRALCAQAFILGHGNPAATLDLCRRADEQSSQLAGQGVRVGRQSADWANALAMEAEALSRIDVSRALRVFDVADEKFGEAWRALPTESPLLVSWGQLLRGKAQALSRRDLSAARRAWAESNEKFLAKMKLDPQAVDAPIEIGLNLLREYAGLQAGERAANQTLLDKAEKVLRTAESLEPGAGSYNLACVFAWRNQPKECVAWLEHTRTLGRLPAREFVLADSYIGLVANSEEFARWLAVAYSR